MPMLSWQWATVANGVANRVTISCMALFGMIHCAHSTPYTRLALASFFRHTPLHDGDRVLLLDNDGGFQAEDARVELLPTGGQSFARNVNTILVLAWRMR